ncbi:hypothetical protein BC829DRAFT_447294 [Chytridium lagenaria]|nr:hypothetical protein BC829DRAFT_447294 [Chytridium lagenaria]
MNPFPNDVDHDVFPASLWDDIDEDAVEGRSMMHDTGGEPLSLESEVLDNPVTNADRDPLKTVSTDELRRMFEKTLGDIKEAGEFGMKPILRLTKRKRGREEDVGFGRSGFAAVEDLACSFHVPRHRLNVVASAKGLVSGPLKIILRDGTWLDCTNSRRENTDETTASYALVIEKEATFFALLDFEFGSTPEGSVVLITGKGYPDVNTRAFVKRLAELRKEQVWCGSVVEEFCGEDVNSTRIQMIYRIHQIRIERALKQRNRVAGYADILEFSDMEDRSENLPPVAISKSTVLSLFVDLPENDEDFIIMSDAEPDHISVPKDQPMPILLAGFDKVPESDDDFLFMSDAEPPLEEAKRVVEPILEVQRDQVVETFPVLASHVPACVGSGFIPDTMSTDASATTTMVFSKRDWSVTRGILLNAGVAGLKELRRQVCHLMHANRKREIQAMDVETLARKYLPFKLKHRDEWL